MPSLTANPTRIPVRRIYSSKPSGRYCHRDVVKILAGDAALVDGIFVGEFDSHAVGEDMSGEMTDLADVGVPHTHMHRLFAVQTHLQCANLRF
jgi:hypothetical protein